MTAKPVQLRVGGQTYRVVSSASADELERLAAVVDEKLLALVPPGKPMTPQAMLLAAMALAHDAEQARLRAERVATRSKAALESLLERVDATLGDAEGTLARLEGAPGDGA